MLSVFDFYIEEAFAICWHVPVPASWCVFSAFLKDAVIVDFGPCVGCCCRYNAVCLPLELVLLVHGLVETADVFGCHGDCLFSRRVKFQALISPVERTASSANRVRCREDCCEPAGEVCAFGRWIVNSHPVFHRCPVTADAKRLVFGWSFPVERRGHCEAAENEALDVTECARWDLFEPCDVDRAADVHSELVIRPGSRPDVVEDGFVVNLLIRGHRDPQGVDSERIGGQLAFFADEHVEMRSGKLH